MSRFKSSFIAFILGLLVLPVGVYFYFRYGTPPVATADNPFPMEEQVVSVPLNARIRREAPADAAMKPTPEVLLAGAHVYREQCAACHGLQGHPSAFANSMFPGAPQLWETHHNGKVVGVSDDPAGETYWKVKNGIRLSGMSAYKSLLTDDQMWQVSVLLANADKPLEPGTAEILSRPMTY